MGRSEYVRKLQKLRKTDRTLTGHGILQQLLYVVKEQLCIHAGLTELGGRGNRLGAMVMLWVHKDRTGMNLHHYGTASLFWRTRVCLGMRESVRRIYHWGPSPPGEIRLGNTLQGWE